MAYDPSNRANCRLLHSTLNDFRLRNILCDVTITDESSSLTYAHSCVLAAASPILKSTLLLKDSNKALFGQGVTLMINGISTGIWKLILEYLYVNKLVAPAMPELLEDLLRASNLLGLKDLSSVLKKHVKVLAQENIQQTSLKITLAPSRHSIYAEKSVQTGKIVSILSFRCCDLFLCY